MSNDGRTRHFHITTMLSGLKISNIQIAAMELRGTRGVIIYPSLAS